MKHKSESMSATGGVVKGAMVGMLVGAAAVVLSKKDNRVKLQKHVKKALEMGEDTFNSTSDKIEKFRNQAEDKVSKGAQKLNERLSEAKDDVKKLTR